MELIEILESLNEGNIVKCDSNEVHSIIEFIELHYVGDNEYFNLEYNGTNWMISKNKYRKISNI